MDWDAFFNSTPFLSGSDWARQDDSLLLPTPSVSPTNISDTQISHSPSDCARLLENSSSPPTPLTPDCSSGRIDQIVPRRKPIPRKGHTKSRRGCFNCKKRKIKCQETRPLCANCDKSGIPCQYPKAPQAAPSSLSMSVPSPIMQPQATPTVFSMVDMRYFHHFLVRAYPHLPVGSDSIWTLHIPAYAHKYGFLLRSMLALGASHLTVVGPPQPEVQLRALSHRVEAVKLLNQALCTPAESRDEADARFASLMILTFQSSCIVDGLFDFLTMLRGCILQGELGDGSYFSSFIKDRHIETVNAKIRAADIDPIENPVLAGAMRSVRALQPLCRKGVEKKYLEHLTSVFELACVSPQSAYGAFVELYNLMGTISHVEFKHMINQSNGVAQVLIGHFLAVHALLRPIAVHERSARDMTALYKVLEPWALRIHSELDPDLKPLHAWPVAFIQEHCPMVDPKIEAVMMATSETTEF